MNHILKLWCLLDVQHVCAHFVLIIIITDVQRHCECVGTTEAEPGPASALHG